MSPRPTICACVITSGGDQVLARAVRNDETAVAALFDAAAAHGSPALVIDTTSSTAALLMHAAAQRGLPVAYVTGLAMRRAAELYAGAAKTDPKDAYVLADYAMRNADRSGLGQPQRRTADWFADPPTAVTLTSQPMPPGSRTVCATRCCRCRPRWSAPSATSSSPAAGSATP